MTDATKPNVLVVASLFPSRARPTAGLFIRERMFRVARQLPLQVVVPKPWFPLQGLLRIWKPEYRPRQPAYEEQQGINVTFVNFLSLPGIGRRLDGFFMALACYLKVRRWPREQGVNLLDAHFAYPEGYAATLLGRWLKLPVSITLRGSEVPLAKDSARCKRMVTAVNQAQQVFAVSDSLRRHMIDLGGPPDNIQVVGNGVDAELFRPIEQAQARQQLDLPADAEILISVGGLVERKGFHRVLDILPQLFEQHPKLRYLIVGGASAEGDWSNQLKAMVAEKELQSVVHFLGPMAPEDLHGPLSAADVFVLATSNEGWANVFLEAMACGLPVVATDVGGNREVVCRDELGTIVPFGEQDALRAATANALVKHWQKAVIIDYARNNSWDSRVEVITRTFHQMVAQFKAEDQA